METLNDYREMLLDTDYLEQEANHLLCGDYGEEIYLQAVNVLRSRMNAVAWISQKMADVIFNISGQQARKVYLSLDSDEQEKANKVLTDLIREYKLEIIEQGGI